jgi:hypothetical protein
MHWPKQEQVFIVHGRSGIPLPGSGTYILIEKIRENMKLFLKYGIW